jgi:hypothetical protein
MLGGMCEIFIGRQQCHIMPNTKLRKQGINGTELDSCAATSVAQGSRVDVVIPIRLKKWQCSETLDNLCLCRGAEETL